jgi:TRAP-type C4-dicarboxylate transport system substrate-binding protein
MSQAQWDGLSDDVRQVVYDNAVEWRGWQQKACERIQRHDEALAN